MIEAKIWGMSEEILSKQTFEIKRIIIKKGGYCSKHSHDYKYNGFYIESGKLKITTWDNDLVQHVILTDGNFLQIEPKVKHKFDALCDVVCYEIYWVELRGDDIQRDEKGGVK